MSDPKIKFARLESLDSLDDMDPPISIEECEPHHLMRHEFLMGLLEEFLLTDDYSKLRKYIKEGGNVDKINEKTFKLRDIIVEAMEPDFAQNPKGKKDVEMITFYLAVCERVLSEKYSDPGKPNTIRAATKFTAENHKPHPIEFKTAEKQFSEGRKRFIEKFGKPWIET